MKNYIRILREGGVLAIPTDTVYGLAADATNPQAVAKVFTIKGRGEEKALPIFAMDLAMARTIAEISPSQETFLQRVWPGKVTAVLRLRNDAPLAKNAVASDGTVALRVPNHPLVRDLLQRFQKPITGTSANKSGLASCRNTASLRSQLAGNLPDYIIDGGELPESLPSTIVDLTKRTPTIIRNGAADKKVLEQIANLLQSGN